MEKNELDGYHVKAPRPPIRFSVPVDESGLGL